MSRASDLFIASKISELLDGLDPGRQLDIVALALGDEHVVSPETQGSTAERMVEVLRKNGGSMVIKDLAAAVGRSPRQVRDLALASKVMGREHGAVFLKEVDRG